MSEVTRPAPEAEAALRSVLGDLDGRLSLFACMYSLASPRRKGTRVVLAGLWPAVAMGTERPGRFETGDLQFDGVLDLEGSPGQVHAVLNARARGDLEAFARAHRGLEVFRVSGGEWRMDVPARLTKKRSSTALETTVAAAIQAARHLLPPEDVAARLAANAREDPLPAVRLGNLQALARDFPDAEATEDALRAAASDADSEVRLAAAQRLRGDGPRLLLELATSLEVEDSCSARALDTLPPLPLEQTREIMQKALPRRPLTARACVDALRRKGDAGAVPLLADVLASQKGVLALAAVKALAHLGTAAAVLPLQEAARSGDGEVRAAARTAAADVQARLVGTPGELALAGGDGGQVSLAEDPRGRVALDAAPERR